MGRLREQVITSCCSDAVADGMVPGAVRRLLSSLPILLDLLTSCSRGPWMALTFRFDPQGCPDQGKQGGIEHDGPIAVQRHVHGDKALERKTKPMNRADGSTELPKKDARRAGGSLYGCCWESGMSHCDIFKTIGKSGLHFPKGEEVDSVLLRCALNWQQKLHQGFAGCHLPYEIYPGTRGGMPQEVGLQEVQHTSLSEKLTDGSSQIGDFSILLSCASVALGPGGCHWCTWGHHVKGVMEPTLRVWSRVSFLRLHRVLY